MLFETIRKTVYKLIMTALFMGIAVLVYGLVYHALPLVFTLVAGGILILALNFVCGVILEDADAQEDTITVVTSGIEYIPSPEYHPAA